MSWRLKFTVLYCYYVINFSEMRQKFDNGEDPLDPEAQQGHGGHPFHGHPFGGGGPFQFKFHFNWSRPPRYQTSQHFLHNQIFGEYFGKEELLKWTLQVLLFANILHYRLCAYSVSETDKAQRIICNYSRPTMPRFFCFVESVTIDEDLLSVVRRFENVWWKWNWTKVSPFKVIEMN